jgi:RNA polymerase sigma-70 factor (ECF subfamily)
VVLAEQELLKSWQNGSEMAFEQIYKRQAPILLTHAMRKINDRTISEELVQDTFVVFYRHRYHAESIKSLSAYLYTILKNKILDYYRHEMVLRKYEDHLAAKLASELYVDERSLELKELESFIHQNIEKLPKQCQKVYKLSREQLLSNKEIANQLNISENTVEQHMRKALRLLKTSLTLYIRILIILVLFKL